MIVIELLSGSNCVEVGLVGVCTPICFLEDKHAGLVYKMNLIII